MCIGKALNLHDVSCGTYGIHIHSLSGTEGFFQEREALSEGRSYVAEQVEILESFVLTFKAILTSPASSVLEAQPAKMVVVRDRCFGCLKWLGMSKRQTLVHGTY